MAFFPKMLDNDTKQYQILDQNTGMEERMLADFPLWRDKAIQLYPDWETANNVASELNTNLKLYSSVVIATDRKGSEGKGYDLYAVQRLLDAAFWLLTGAFAKVGFFHPSVRLYDTEGDARGEAEKSGYTVVKQPEKLVFVKQHLPSTRRVIIRVEGIQKTSYMVRVFSEVSKDFPGIEPEEIEIHYYPRLRCFGVEFIVPHTTEMPAEYEVISALEPSEETLK